MKNNDKLEDWKAEFDDKFDYIKLCSTITDSRYTNERYFDTSLTKAGTRIMYDSMVGNCKKFIQDLLKAERAKLKKELIEAKQPLKDFKECINNKLDANKCLQFIDIASVRITKIIKEVQGE